MSLAFFFLGFAFDFGCVGVAGSASNCFGFRTRFDLRGSVFLIGIEEGPLPIPFSIRSGTGPTTGSETVAIL